MKNMKKILALLVAMMIIAASFGALAATLTIDQSDANIAEGHTFDAYAILTGTLSSDGTTLSNLAWGDGITPATLIAKVTAADSPIKDKFDGITAESTPTQFAAKLSTLTAAADIEAFRDMVKESLSSTKAATNSASPITLPTDGYYFVEDVTTLSNTEPDAKSAYILQVVGEKTIKIKADAPDVDKKIVDSNGTEDANTANIGDTVNYQITSDIPDYSKYKEYYMDFEDTLSKGLTLTDDYEANNAEKPGAFTVKVGTTTLVRDTDYTVTTTANEDGSTKIEIHLKDIKSRNYTVGAAVTIDYSVVVNDDAVIGDAGNPNTVKLKYSRDPSHSGDGTPDNPDDDIVTGETPEHEVNTYVVGIRFTKVKAGTTETLAGAVFKVNATSINKVLITGERFVEDATGTYYKLKDKSGNDAGYTTTAPTELTKAQYADLASDSLTATKMYKKESYATTSVEETANQTFEVTTGSDGIVELKGLKEGTYTFTEIQAPDGYNLLDAPIVVVISSNIESVDKDTQFAWSAKKDNTALQLTKVGDSSVYEFEFTVENAAGNTLPSTGGIGTTIFYVAGSILVLAAVVLLVTKRRMSADE